MSLPSPNFSYNINHRPEFDRLLAPVPLRRTQPWPGYANFVSRPDGTIAPGTWNCSCSNSFGPPYGQKDNNNAVVDPGTVQGGAFYSEVNCSGQRGQCNDPRAYTYDPNATNPDQLSCIYPTATAFEDCSSARKPVNGCNRTPFWPHQHSG